MSAVSGENQMSTDKPLQIVEVAVEPLTQAAFEPYGQILGDPDREPVWVREGLTSWRMDFAIEGTPDLKVTRFHYRPRTEFERLERHLTYTESRMPLGGARALFVVAASTDLDDPTELPEPASIRAFYLDGTRGVMLWKGTWHALDSFPLTAPHVDFLLITERETQVEVESSTVAHTTRRTHIADFRPSGMRFRIVDPNQVTGNG